MQLLNFLGLQGDSNKSSEEDDFNVETAIRDIHHMVTAVLMEGGVPVESIADDKIRPQSVLYMIYWFHRLRNNPEEQARIRQNLSEYIGWVIADPLALTDAIFLNEELKEPSRIYAETLLVATKTVDLVITKSGGNDAKEVLCIERHYYPFGSALPGGIIKDEDEDNKLNLPAHVFAALRVAGEKVLRLTKGTQYTQGVDEKGRKYFLVHGEDSVSAVRLYEEDEGGYHYRENTRFVLRPSDPRHIVDTIAFKCEIDGEPHGAIIWKNKLSIMSPNDQTGGFAFGHHREIVAHITAQTSVEKERGMKEREFVRSIVEQPLESYLALKARFAKNGNSPETSFVELFPVVDRLLADLFDEDINELCRSIPVLAGIRDKVVISLRHVCLKNRTFCPYLPALRAIAEAVAVLDVVARQKKGFYNDMEKDKIVEHNPRATQYASYHMYRYKYRFDQLMNMVPHEIVIPTYESFSATDLMHVRGVPIRFIGISKDFLYVDEFEQSPEEFFMHDCNHSWRMIMEDRKAEDSYGRKREALVEGSNAFIREYLGKIKIHAEDNEEEREIKKLKKIILFEITHEDARPFLPDVICKYIQAKEGTPVPFEVPRIDERTGYMDVVDTLDTGISTLSYVRNKLQHGFYDHMDAQQPQIVSPKYRAAEWIARAAQDMLIEMRATPEPGVPLDENGVISYEWLLRRTCAAGPDNIHGEEHVDPAVVKYGDGAQKLNPKRYQAGADK